MTTSMEAVRPRSRRRSRAIDALGAPAAVVTAALLLLAGWGAVVTVPLAVAAALGPALARIDIAERRLPNALTVPLLLVGAAASLLRVAHGDLAALAALACGLVLLSMALAGGMGMGDVKLGLALALAAATLGWAVPLAGLGASVVLGGVLGAAALAVGRRTVPFGPALLLGNGVAAAGGASGLL